MAVPCAMATVHLHAHWTPGNCGVNVIVQWMALIRSCTRPTIAFAWLASVVHVDNVPNMCLQSVIYAIAFRRWIWNLVQ